MNSLLNFRTAIATKLAADSRLTDVHISTHGGDFDRKELMRYAKQTPAAIVSLHRAVGREAGEPIVDIMATIICMAKNEPALRKDAGVMQIVDAVMNILMRFPNQNWGETNVGGVRDVQATNAFSEGIDLEGVAMWVVGWTQSVTLVPTVLVTDAFNTLHVDWDLQPMDNSAELGDVIDAQDDVDLT